MVQWEELVKTGPKYGYFPNSSKTVLVVKDPALMPTARSLFQKTDIKIILDGERHLGAVIGTSEFRETYVKDKVNKWI